MRSRIACKRIKLPEPVRKHVQAPPPEPPREPASIYSNIILSSNSYEFELACSLHRLYINNVKFDSIYIPNFNNDEISELKSKYRYLEFSNTIQNENKKVLEISDCYSKINGIDHICWINLDRSKKRRIHMEHLLKNIDVPNTRISAVDGLLEKVEDYIENTETHLSDYEIACTLSHIKALSYLNDCPGNYFLIVEDDVCVDNLYFLKDSLQNIISEAPTFDIMLLFKTCFTKFNSKYISWNEEYNKGLENHIAGTVAYIIHKEAIPKILEKIKYDFSTSQFIITKPFEIDVADIFLYKYTNTLTYKYNFFATLNEDSEIHKDHLHFHKKTSVNSFQEIINDLWTETNYHE